ncbi:hypothetical protein Tco_1524095 [Tanacetum coccineum]
MATLKFADSHNMVAFLSKPTESEGFEKIVDFLNAHPIRYALMVNPTIYISRRIAALLKPSVKELSLADAEVSKYKYNCMDEFSSTMASAIICLATNQKFNFSKLIFDSMVRNLDNLSGIENMI